MAENTYKSNTFKKPDKDKKSKGPKSKSRFNFDFFTDPRLLLALGIFLVIASLFLFTAFVSYLFTGKADQSMVKDLSFQGLLEPGKEIDNWLGILGAWSAHKMIYNWFGISAFFIPPLLFLLGFRLM